MTKTNHVEGTSGIVPGAIVASAFLRVPRPVIPRQRRDGSPMFVPPRPAFAMLLPAYHADVLTSVLLLATVRRVQRIWPRAAGLRRRP